jgi:2-polyprenyl-6-methoxyphenol hydroxylase-like FAD-dependent oxidoreductase
MGESRPRGARILIVGAGVAGLGAARALAGAGFAPELVEREPAWGDAGTGIYLPGNAARALRALGLERDVVDRAVAIPKQRFCDARGRLLLEVDVAALWNGVGPCFALHRAALHAVLLEGAAEVPIRMGVAVRALRERSGTVAVEFDDERTGEYDLVVGADGIHSTVRRLAFGDDARARPVGQVGWRFVTGCSAEITTWSVMLGHRTAFLTLPIGNDRAYCYCDVASTSGQDGDQDPVPLFAGFAQPVPGLLDSVADRGLVHRSTIEEVALDAWTRGRVVLVGDAAHATSPNMAQGAAMALEDGLVLAECLRRVDTIPAALTAFEARRRPRTEWVRAQTHRRDRTRYLPTVVRNTVLRALGRRIFRSNYRPLLDEA